MSSYDVIIRNATLIDGTGSFATKGDLAIKGDRIAAIGRIEGDATREIDAKGKVVAPGFIDPHAHLELLLFLKPESPEYVAQGFTTAVNGNCGHSITPYGSDKVLEYQYRNGLISPEFRRKMGKFSWTNFSEYLTVPANNGGTAINHATLLGHGSLRWSVMDRAKDRPPTEEETAQLRDLVIEGMEQGAVGMSTGLAYIPSRYAKTDEIVELVKVVSKYDGVYASHIRYHIGVTEATKEAIEIGKLTNSRVQISHLSMGAIGAYQAVSEAAQQGIEVLADTIPQSTGHFIRGDRLIQFIMTMTPELFDVGVEGVIQAIQTPEGRARIASIEPFFQMDPNDIYIANTDDSQLEMRTIAELAKELDKKPTDVMFDLLLERNSGVTFWFGKDRGDSDPDFPPAEVIENPYMGPGSDILMVEQSDLLGWYELMRPGCVFHFMSQAKAKGISLEETIRRMTSMVAKHFRITDRGVLTEGAFADIVMFDPEELSYPSRESVDYRTSKHLVTGMSMVLVNGEVVLEDGVQNHRRPGRMLKRG